MPIKTCVPAAAGIALMLALAGCRSSSGSQAVLADPLLVSRKPVEAEAVTAPPVLIALSEPSMPPNPNGTALASKQKSRPGEFTSTPNDGANR